MRVYREKFNLILPPSHGRSEGLHISEVIKDLALATGVLDAKWGPDSDRDIDEDTDKNLMQVGLAWENYLAEFHHPEIEFHPGELKVVRDGLTIYMSPDGVSFLEGDMLSVIGLDCATYCLHEFKFTRKSSRDFGQVLRLNGKKSRMWRWQIMSYAYAMGTRIAKLHVMFANGDYSYGNSSGNPDYHIYRLHIEQEELDANMNTLFNHARVMLARPMARKAIHPKG